MILVPGGNGYIGGAMVSELIRAGLTPVIIDNLSTSSSAQMGRLMEIFKTASSAEPQPRIYKGNIGDPKLLKRIFAENPIRAVMHFAASAEVGESVENPEKYYKNNLAEGINLLSVMNEVGVKTLIFSSTCAVYGNPKTKNLSETHGHDPVNPYGRTKLAMEWMMSDFCQAYGFKTVSFRYFNASGALADGTWGEDHDPETHLIPRVLDAIRTEGEISIFGEDYETEDGTCIRDYIHICDLASAHLKGLEWIEGQADGTREVFNLGSEKGTSVREIISLCEKVTGKKAKVRITNRRPGDPDRLVADSTKARGQLGWTPTFDAQRIVETAWQWHKLGIDS